MNNDTQIFKGILEGCILRIAERGEIYGYRAVEELNRLGFDVNEATVYPILARLQTRGCLGATKRPSPLGPDRKYYSLTPDGRTELRDFMETWGRIRGLVDKVMEENGHDAER